MDKTSLHDSERFKDPLGDYMRAAQASQKQHLAKYPDVADVYKGFYGKFEPFDNEGATFLGSSEAIIGTELKLRQTKEGLGFFGRSERCIAYLEKDLSKELSALLDEGWTIHCILAFIIFVSEKKTFSAQFACFCCSPELTDEQKTVLENFIRNMVGRIADATHPGLDLTQEQFVRVIESRGEWFLTKREPWPELQKGSVYYRRRRTFNDRLIGAALKGNIGCAVASWTATAIIIIAIGLAIWFFFFSG